MLGICILVGMKGGEEGLWVYRERVGELCVCGGRCGDGKKTCTGYKTLVDKRGILLLEMLNPTMSDVRIN